MRRPNLLISHLDKLFVVDLAIAVNVSLPDHLFHLFVRQLFPQVCHHMSQLHHRSTESAGQNGCDHAHVGKCGDHSAYRCNEYEYATAPKLQAFQFSVQVSNSFQA